METRLPEEFKSPTHSGSFVVGAHPDQGPLTDCDSPVTGLDRDASKLSAKELICDAICAAALFVMVFAVLMIPEVS